MTDECAHERTVQSAHANEQLTGWVTTVTISCADCGARVKSFAVPGRQA